MINSVARCLLGVNVLSLLNGLWIFINTPIIVAVFTFSSVVWVYLFTKKHELWMKHNRALIGAEQLANRNLNSLYNNLYLMQGSIETLERENFSSNELYSITTPDYAIDFQNLDLIDIFLDYETTITKLNHGMETLNRSGRQIFEVRSSGTLSPEDESINKRMLAEQTIVLSRFLEDAIEETYTLGAYTRVFIRKDKFTWFGNGTSKLKIAEEELKREREVFLGESNDTKEKSKKKINEILNGK